MPLPPPGLRLLPDKWSGGQVLKLDADGEREDFFHALPLDKSLRKALLTHDGVDWDLFDSRRRHPERQRFSPKSLYLSDAPSNFCLKILIHKKESPNREKTVRAFHTRGTDGEGLESKRDRAAISRQRADNRSARSEGSANVLRRVRR